MLPDEFATGEDGGEYTDQEAHVTVLIIVLVLIAVAAAVAAWIYYNNSQRRGKILISPPARKPSEPEEGSQP